jgi:hypothetical protein
MALTDADKEKRIEAFTRLAMATREKIDRATYVLYLEDTADYSTAVVTMACRRLEHSSKWFPKVGELREECGKVATRMAEAAETKRRLALNPPPISEEKWAEIRAKLQEIIGRRSF